jgi:hypothetical protein
VLAEAAIDGRSIAILEPLENHEERHAAIIRRRAKRRKRVEPKT